MLDHDIKTVHKNETVHTVEISALEQQQFILDAIAAHLGLDEAARQSAKIHVGYCSSSAPPQLPGSLSRVQATVTIDNAAAGAMRPQVAPPPWHHSQSEAYKRSVAPAAPGEAS